MNKEEILKKVKNGLNSMALEDILSKFDEYGIPYTIPNIAGSRYKKLESDIVIHSRINGILSNSIAFDTRCSQFEITLGDVA